MTDNCQTNVRRIDPNCLTNQINQNISFIYINVFRKWVTNGKVPVRNGFKARYSILPENEDVILHRKLPPRVEHGGLIKRCREKTGRTIIDFSASLNPFPPGIVTDSPSGPLRSLSR